MLPAFLARRSTELDATIGNAANDDVGELDRVVVFGPFVAAAFRTNDRLDVDLNIIFCHS